MTAYHVLWPLESSYENVRRGIPYVISNYRMKQISHIGCIASTTFFQSSSPPLSPLPPSPSPPSPSAPSPSPPSPLSPSPSPPLPSPPSPSPLLQSPGSGILFLDYSLMNFM